MLTKAQLRKPLFILPVLIVVYFLAFPADLDVIIGPVTDVLILVSTVLTKVLAMSGVVSPWLYILLSVMILSRTLIRIWGHKSKG
jgi:hypothetical protein